jgi:hypothetical protein
VAGEGQNHIEVLPPVERDLALLPPHLVQPHRLVEPLQVYLASVSEQELLALRQLPDGF